MKNAVMIKGSSSGITLVLDNTLDWTELKECIAERIKASAKFFGNADTALIIEGRDTTDEENREILDIISEHSNLNVVCIVDPDKEKEEFCKKSLEEKLAELNSNTGQFYKGTLRSGQLLETQTSIIILGDVKPGAKVISTGNIIVLGSLQGNAFAGVSGNDKAFVLAMDMQPVQIRISDYIGRSPDKPDKKAKKGPQIAYVEDGNIYVEPFCKEVINDIIS